MLNEQEALDSLRRLKPVKAKRIGTDARGAAQILGVAQSTLAEWQRQGKVPFCKIGGRVFYSLSALKTWLAELCNRRAAVELEPRPKGKKAKRNQPTGTQ
ncbi:MAG: helix-turn-helix domain-containing protein [Pirellulales bacterium]|nr:helix-turn-helix domain-containing protein [Pirellulales bacterium]